MITFEGRCRYLDASPMSGVPGLASYCLVIEVEQCEAGHEFFRPDEARKYLLIG